MALEREDLNDALSGDDDPDAPVKIPGLWTRSPCRNSVELRILADSYSEPALQVEMPFIEDDGEPETVQPPSEPTEADRVHAAISDYYQVRIAIARAMPPGHDSEADFATALKREGLVP
jgi:hypothetical protein